VRYIITVVTNEGEAIINIVGNVHPPRFDPTFWEWGEYQKVLRKWLEQYTTELGRVCDDEESLAFVVYKVEE